MRTFLRQHLIVRSCVAVCRIAIMLAIVAAAAGAQQTATITGVITDLRSKQPVSGATVMIVGTRVAARSGDDGRYRLAAVPVGAQALSVARIGYATQRRNVSVNNDQVIEFVLESVATSLDEVVVTGTATHDRTIRCCLRNVRMTNLL